MAIEITVPRLGWSMDEGTLTEWLKRDGDFVRKGEMLFVLEGDKAAQEVECFDDGILRLLPDAPQPGETVRVGQLLAYLVAEGELAPSPATRSAGSAKQSVATQTAVGPDPGPRRSVRVAAAVTEAATPRASPRARRRAAELGVDWTGLAGTGKTGRVRERDVLAAVGRREPRAVMLELPAAATAMTLRPHSPIRRTIAERMLASHLSTAPVTLTSTADATNLVSLRKQFQTAATAPETVVPSVTDFIVKLTALVLPAHPALNSAWHDDGIAISSEIHIGIAVDTEAGLLVPVVRNVEQLSLRSLAQRSRELIGQARARRLPADAMQGGTFTVTNLGAYGIDAFTPIIQMPQCAILGIGRIHTAPAFVDNQCVPRDTITLSLTFNHRMVDGAPAARFLQAVCQAIENPAERLIQ